MADEARGDEPAGTEYDERLDFFSPNFDPLLALETTNVQPPVPVAKVHDNIQMYHCAQNKKPSSGKTSTVVKPGSSKTQQVAPLFERKFLPHQLPVKIERAPRKPLGNVLTKMDEITGPLQVLKDCMDRRVRIKVWTRSGHGIRGHCVAFLTAFDKYWNMSLVEVTEIWTRPKRRKVPALDGFKENRKDEDMESRRGLFPDVAVIEQGKKTETCRRYVNELLVRGEQVAFIVVLQGQE
ncbi:PREDICTED: U7 snRNA-associated Sm-like protein LSm11 [Nicrophorus vespilloides]|uniref:U7 snRNA-associated Sm-like protein LSm11 n=1 Tax=Nicrophorus vespilloides TaxID=110193 RepID=A0ABM1M2P2_NICVS|nr:PREDICTED: U7 snRNA-associated Sm-like protein LSm11 [Nicrophorus vespilloides]